MLTTTRHCYSSTDESWLQQISEMPKCLELCFKIGLKFADTNHLLWRFYGTQTQYRLYITKDAFESVLQTENEGHRKHILLRI